MEWLIIAIEIVGLALLFTANWNSAIAELGEFDCIQTIFTADTTGNFTANPRTVSGDIGFAEVYMYGLPLSDGMVLGAGPWPAAGNMREFYLEGYGPA